MIDADLKARLDAAALEAVRPVAVGLALLHVVLSFGHISMLDSSIRTAVIAVNTGAAAILVGLTILLGRWRPEPRFGPILAAAVAVVAITSATAMLLLTRKPEYTTNLSLLAIGAGLFVLSTPWLVAVFAIALVPWTAIALHSAESPLWLFFFFNLVGSIAVGLGAHFVRLRTTIRAERSRREATEREVALGSSEERYALSVAGANDGVYDWDLTEGAAYYSARFKAILGFHEHELRDDPQIVSDRIHPDDAARVRSQMVDHLKGLTPHFEDEYRMLHKDGSYRWVLTRGVTVRDAHGRAIRMAGSMTDMTGRGVFDPLTALPNRMLLIDRLRRVFARSQRHGIPFALLFLDLDRFKIINDSLGHHTGDELLIQVARRLQIAVRASDTVARLGGDEFVVILEDLTGRDLQASIRRIEEEVVGHYQVGDREIYITLSIGAVVDTENYEMAEEILRDADTAMYTAKHSDRSHAVFDVEMREAARRRLEIESEVRRALEAEHFGLAFQPIVSIGDNSVYAVEALARWRHPMRGWIEPGEFIPIMEEIGIIQAFTSWTLLEACRQLVAWDVNRAEGSPGVTVNVSGRQLFRDTFADDVSAILDRTGLTPDRLILELTENAMMERGDAATQTIARLRQLGVRIMLDDFGTGHSSLGSLHSLPIDSLKVDRSFIHRLAEESQTVELVRAMIGLGHNLGARIVAEGIETEAQVTILRDLGCDLGQGNHFGPPGELNDICARIRTRTALAAAT
jgi:diguanylate cyclase (GGDEF)-like protein/PAS domain S-box-containing protein